MSPVNVSRYYTGMDVMEAGRRRFSWIFDEFKDVMVTSSGGKDSCIVMNLALDEATKRGRLPLKVLFIDQEAEWQGVVDYMRMLHADERINLIWLQCPLRISNAASEAQDWIDCWGPDKEDQWMRPREPYTVHENPWDDHKFTHMFWWAATEYGADVVLGGMRCEESPGRRLGLTGVAAHKWVTWGMYEEEWRGRQGPVTLHPIYDWYSHDVWKAMLENDWPYCRVYDQMYQIGVPFRNMRISSFCHSTALHSLTYLHELEPETWDRLQARLAGINGARHINLVRFAPTKLPLYKGSPIFEDWREYRDHLAENLITGAEARTKIKDSWTAPTDRKFEGTPFEDVWMKACVRAITLMDWHGTHLDNVRVSLNLRYSDWYGDLDPDAQAAVDANMDQLRAEHKTRRAERVAAYDEVIRLRKEEQKRLREEAKHERQRVA